MKIKAPNYLYPLATQRTLQWTKQTVRGENSQKRPFQPKRFNAVKKGIVRALVKNKTPIKFGSKAKTREMLNPFLKASLPMDPMKAPDPRPGNARHITNTREAYGVIQN
jgi:hypothetical protein